MKESVGGCRRWFRYQCVPKPFVIPGFDTPVDRDDRQGGSDTQVREVLTTRARALHADVTGRVVETPDRYTCRDSSASGAPRTRAALIPPPESRLLAHEENPQPRSSRAGDSCSLPADQPKQFSIGSGLPLQLVGALPLIADLLSTVTLPCSLDTPPGAKVERLRATCEFDRSTSPRTL